MIKLEDVDSGNIFYPSNSDKILMSDNTTLSAWAEETEKRLSEAPPSSGGGEITKLKALSISVNSAELCKYDGSAIKSVNIAVPEPVVIPDQKMLTVMVNSAEVCKYDGKLDKTVSITIPEPTVIPEQKVLTVTINGTEACKYDGSTDKSVAITIPATPDPHEETKAINVSGVLLTGTTSIKLIEALISPMTQSPIILPYKGSSGLYVESVESGAITITTGTTATEDIKVEVLMILSTAPHNPTPTP